jgi:toxin ParE1/3/4
MARVIWAPRAISGLEEICGYIAEDSALYARVFAQHIVARIKTIAQFPNAGRVVPEYRRLDIRELIFQNYRIVYRVKPDVVEIAAIVHGARLLRKLEE